jgi:hypothetical protein
VSLGVVLGDELHVLLVHGEAVEELVVRVRLVELRHEASKGGLSLRLGHGGADGDTCSGERAQRDVRGAAHEWEAHVTERKKHSHTQVDFSLDDNTPTHSHSGLTEQRDEKDGVLQHGNVDAFYAPGR